MSASEEVTRTDGPAPPGVGQRVWAAIVDWVDRLWAWPVRMSELVGAHVLLLMQAVAWGMRPPYRFGVFAEAMEYIGFQSLFIVTLVGTFVGMVFALQLTSALRQFGTEGYVGATVGLALSRELAPVFTAIIVAARAGSGMATELGSMRITEQIDALSTMAVSPVQYLVTPRLLAGTVMIPMLAMLFDVVGMVGAYLVAVGLLNVDHGIFVETTRWIVDARDILQGLIKATAFGLALTLLSCYQGFNASGGAKGVGIATTRAVVGSVVTVLVLDYFFTDIILTVQHR